MESLHSVHISFRYISRNDDELDQIELKHSIGGRTKRQHASREDIIRMTKSREQTEYDTCGIGENKKINNCSLLVFSELFSLR